MSRRKKNQEAARAHEPAPRAQAGPERLRRWLLGLVVALIVARPIVLGEDPGLLFPTTDPSHLTLTFFWLLAAVGWAGWRVWAGKGAWYGGVTEAALLATVVTAVVSTLGAATYKHPAILISWEWLALFVALFLVRQLVQSEAEQRALLAVFLANAVALSAHALFQYTVELPALREGHAAAQVEHQDATPEQLGLVLGGPGMYALVEGGGLPDSTLGPSFEEGIARRVRENDHAYATYGHPNTFAGFLALFLPALAAAAVVRWRVDRAGPMTLVTLICLLLALAALWTTHSRGAMLGLAAVALLAPAVLMRGRPVLRVALAVALPAVAAGIALVAWQQGWLSGPLGKGDGTARNRLDYWSATAAMIRQHPWLGVGPGNFGREYPKYMSPSAYETIADPHNFALELWSTMGVFALLAVLVALGAFFWRALKAPPGAATEPEEERTRWEFYVGGTVGLLVGFALHQGNQSPDLRLMLRQSTSADAEALLNGLVAGLRAVVWFAAFALFERLPLSPRGRALALAAGVAALLGNLMVSGGIGAPSLAMFLWVAVGLALTSSKTPAHGQEGAPGWGSRVAVMSVTTGFALAYLIYVFYPVTYASSLAWSALDAAAIYSNDETKAIRQLPREKRSPAHFLDDKVVTPLRQATETDPINARWHLHLAQWTAELWKRSPADQRRPEEQELPRAEAGELGKRSPADQKRSLLYSNNALAAAGEALKYDPDGREGYLEKYRLHLFFAHYKKGEERLRLLDNAATALRELLRRDPTAAPFHYQLARTLQAAGRRIEAVEAAETALHFDALVGKPPRRLNAWQRFHARILARVAP